MSLDVYYSERPRNQSRGLRSVTVLFGVTALLAGLVSGPSALANTIEPAPPPEGPTSPLLPDTADPADPVSQDEAPSPTLSETAHPIEPTLEPLPGTVEPTEPAPAPSPSAEESAPTAPEAVNVGRPAINTKPGVRIASGATVFTDGGQWQNAEKLEFKWSGVDGLSLKTESATAGSTSTFTIPASLRGGVLRITVRGINADGIASAPVSASVDVPKGDFTATWNGAVSGKPAVGQKLSIVAPVLNPSGAVTYKWYRGVAEIRGATSASYTITPADAAQKLSVKVTVTGTGMNPLTLTSKTVAVAIGTFSSSPAPAIAGSATVGSRLTAAPGNWSPTDAALGYQWYRGGSAISGATARTYSATSADLGKELKVRVRASKPGYTTLDRWSSPRKVAAGTIAAIRWPAVSGTARFGQTLKVSQEWTSGSAVGYQWYSNGKAIRGGTRSTLYLGTSYVGTKVSVRVTVSKPGYTTRQVTTQAVAIGKASMVVKANPTISGTKKAGNRLTASNGSFSPVPSAYTYQWFRNGAFISGANRNTYVLTTADSGRKITVRVTARKAGYHDAAATSGAVAIYAPPRTVISRDGTLRVGSEIKPGLYKATGTGASCYWETTSGFTGKFSEINNNYFGSARTYVQILSSDRGFKTSGCGTWTTVPETGANASKLTTDGTFRVGIDIRPGLYRISGTGTSCYWETTTGFSGDFDQIIDNYFGSARSYVEIPSTAKGFQVSRCGTLTRIS